MGSMTLDEAKKQICERKNMYDSIVNRIEDPYNPAKNFYEGEACGLSEAIDILAKVEPVVNPGKMNLDNVIRNLESDEAVCRSHSEDDYYRGMADGYKLSIDAFKQLSGNPEQLTLKELAHELRKIFKFKYLTASLNTRIHLWSGRAPIYRINGKYWTSDFIKTSVLGELMGMELVNVLDLSEYKDADGNIDYSKCIVEVE